MEHDSDNRTSPERERADWLCLRIADCQRMSTKKHDMHMACMSKHGMYVQARHVRQVLLRVPNLAPLGVRKVFIR